MEDSKILIYNRYCKTHWVSTLTFHYRDREDFLNAFFNELEYCKLKNRFVNVLNEKGVDVYLHPSEIEKCEISIIKL